MKPGTDIHTLLIQKRDEILALAHRRVQRTSGFSDPWHGTRPGQTAISIS
ncbi:hypothetical protein L21_2071 [Methanoculleus chikugoensis]|uniref:Uncharacterized protein n=1 Tax=Methanoculleus chikugoensis TaxID=118126 RepID=A0A1M4MMU3_9EURY|nr:hypothetical protein L21_2071 [Methanoculleus chikugoensis]